MRRWKTYKARFPIGALPAGWFTFQDTEGKWRCKWCPEGKLQEIVSDTLAAAPSPDDNGDTNG